MIANKKRPAAWAKLTFITGVAVIFLLSCTAEEKQSLPSDLENQKIVLETTLAFAQAVNAKDLSLFRNQTTKEFKAEFSHEQFETVFAGFIKQEINLLPAAKLNPEFHIPPILSDDGTLILRGYFPTRPSQIEFDYNYLWRNGGWKISGISLEINPVTTHKP
ncbi:hypothetical protein A9Q88_00405 [Gammaproteobacteria bacterium 50_400_T64]|nr:hypothetical protein A9Q88_00405 [Gammaproteobacteria bacterium 50_400_T64]